MNDVLLTVLSIVFGITASFLINTLVQRSADVRKLTLEHRVIELEKVLSPIYELIQESLALDNEFQGFSSETSNKIYDIILENNSYVHPEILDKLVAIKTVYQDRIEFESIENMGHVQNEAEKNSDFLENESNFSTYFYELDFISEVEKRHNKIRKSLQLPYRKKSFKNLVSWFKKLKRKYDSYSMKRKLKKEKKKK